MSPLSPPSFSGQDVYYSQNVFINKVQVGLWKPPEPGDAAIFNVSVPPDPPQPTFTPEQQAAMSKSQTEAANNPGAYGQVIVGGPNDGTMVNTVEGQIPEPGATGADFSGDPKTTTAIIPIPPGSTPYQQLNINIANAINEAYYQGKWKRTGHNPNILACFADMGHSEIKSDGPTAWCAAFAGSMLKRSGLPYRQGNLAAYGYKNFGKSIPLTDYSAWRLNDVVVLSTSHVCFLQAVDPVSRNFTIIGGNQGDPPGPSDVTQLNWGRGQLGLIVYVGRQWDIPPDLDKSVVKTIIGAKGAQAPTK